jgi:hypothetical protein
MSKAPELVKNFPSQRNTKFKEERKVDKGVNTRAGRVYLIPATLHVIACESHITIPSVPLNTTTS